MPNKSSDSDKNKKKPAGFSSKPIKKSKETRKQGNKEEDIKNMEEGIKNKEGGQDVGEPASDEGIEEVTNSLVAQTLDREITTEMEESYLTYAMSVIVMRALPDVRDGID